MKTQHLAPIVSLAICFGALTAHSQYYPVIPEGAGPYFRAELGPSVFEHGRLTEFGGPVSGAVDYRRGLTADAAIGYAFNKYLGLDFELGFNDAKIKSVSGFFTDGTYLYNAPFLANVTLSYPIPRSIVTPYVGVGAGGSATVLDTDGLSDGSTTVFGRESDVVFAWQAFAGLRFRLNRQMSLGVGYKYFATEDPSFSYPPAFPASGPNFPVGFKGVRTHSILATFQISFW